MARKVERDKQFGKGYGWCTKHKGFLPLDNFGKASHHNDYGHTNWCKSCLSSQRKGNKAIQEKAKIYNRELKAYYKKLLGGRCAKCGYSKTQMGLDFHHINRADKEYNLNKLISTNNHPRIVLEMDKCLLLCKNCHSELEASCWTAEFKKVTIGWTIKDGSIVEDGAECWRVPSDKILYEQSAMFDLE